MKLEIKQVNGLQPILDTKISGTGSATASYIPKFSSSTELTNSVMYELTNNIGIGTVLPAAKLHTKSNSTYNFIADGSTQSNLFVIKDNGNIGIGVNPNSNLHVLGTIKFDTGNQGLGKVLTSDAFGNAEWATASGISSVSNGLSLNGFDVVLGGTLSYNTTIDGNFTNSLLFNNLSTLSLGATSGNISINDGKGLVYTSDYSATFVTHSLVTKKYVDTKIGGITPSSLSQVLQVGNTTSGNNIILSDGDYIFGSGLNSTITFGNDSSVYAGFSPISGESSALELNISHAQITYQGSTALGGGVSSRNLYTRVYHTDLVKLDSPVIEIQDNNVLSFKQLTDTSTIYYNNLGLNFTESTLSGYIFQDASILAQRNIALGINSANDGSLLFYNGNNSNYVILATNNTISNYTIYLPTQQGATDSILKNDGTGQLSFVNVNTLVSGNGVTASGTTNYISKFTNTNVLGNSQIYDNGTCVGIGTTGSTYKLQVAGTTRFSGASVFGSPASDIIANVVNLDLAYKVAFDGIVALSYGTASDAVKLSGGETNGRILLNTNLGVEIGRFSNTGLAINTGADSSAWLHVKSTSGSPSALRVDGSSINDIFKVDDTSVVSSYYGYWINGLISLAQDVTGSGNLFVGYTKPALNKSSGSGNTIIGNYAANNSLNTALNNSVIIGFASGQYNNAGGNVLIGKSAAWQSTSADENVIVGGLAGSSLTTGSYNTFLGSRADVSNGTINNSITLGYGAKSYASDEFIVGDYSRGGISQAYFGAGRYSHPDVTAGGTLYRFSLSVSGINPTVANTDKSAATGIFYIDGARGTGTGSGGDIIFRTAPAGSTGYTQNSLVEVLRITQDTKIRYQDGSQGSGKVLTSDANGVATWTSITTGTASGIGSVNKYAMTTNLVANTPLTATHSLMTTDVTVTVWDNNGEVSYPKIGNRTTTTVDITSTQNITGARIVVTG